MAGHVSLAPNLSWQILGLLKEKASGSQCLDVASKSQRQVMMMMLRGGAAPLMIESGGGESC